jgi:hypothetical protein
MNRHHFEVIDPYDDIPCICRNCRLEASGHDLPDTECPVVPVTIESLQAQIAARDALLDRVVTEVGRTITPELRADIDQVLASNAPEQSKPILLWRAPREPKPEPVALLSYGGKTFAINYTLMGWISGWVLMGQVGTAVAATDAIDNTRAALEGIEAMMGRDANPMSPDQIEFYKGHGLYREAQWPYIKDFSDSPADEAKGEKFRVGNSA